MHVTIDAFGDSELLNDLHYVYRFLEQMPLDIGMKPLMPPMTLIYDKCRDDKEWGVTGFVIIAESHVSIHTYPFKKYLTMDVYSCKGFSMKEVVKLATSWFKLSNVKVNVLHRGINI